MSHCQELSTRSSYCCCCEPTRCSGFAEHALHPGAASARLGSKQRSRAARAEAARAGRWWSWLDSNGVLFFVQQYDRGICCRLQRQQHGLLLYKYLVPGTWYVVGVVSVSYHTKKMKCLSFPRAAHRILHSYKEVQIKSQTEGAKRVHS